MRTVLVIEDNVLNLKLVQAALEDDGYRVLVAGNAEQALSLAFTHRPALVLMDIHLPGMDGVTALQYLRNDPQTRATKVIALTALKGDRERFLAAGFDGYLAKPFDVEQLRDAVRAGMA